MTTETFQVKGMTCNHCVMAVKKAVGAVDGVSGVEVSLAEGTVTVTGTDVAKEDVIQAIRDAGYEVE
ncbi:MAG: heavy-metal-associated domain-containing protein [Firmicutes bacterium]|nr:heavy-metal-associated domain-containing protein [Bacillota bacterium]